jgi:Calx-beta domain/WD40-like Beta Propeller Repeat
VPLSLCVLLTAMTAIPARGQRPTLVTVQTGGVASGSGLSEDPVTSANGRFVAFESFAFDLVIPNDQNGRWDVFVRDLQTGVTTFVSVNLAGTGGGNGDSRKPTISADGRYVAFESSASNLVANDTNNTSDVFVRDLQTNTTILVSVNSAGTGPGNQFSNQAVISANGRVVVFSSSASNLAPNDSNNTVDVFARDLQTSTTSLVSINANGTNSGNDASFPENVPKDKAPRAVISKDGRFVVFDSNATDLVTLSDANGHGTDVFARDLQANVTSLVSINRLGTASGDGGGTQPVISGNGRVVFFQSSSTNLTANGAPFSFNLYARDLQTGTTTMVSVTTSNGPSTGPSNLSYFPVASDDGRYVIFQSNANNYVVGDSNNHYDVFLRDLQTSTTSLVSVAAGGGPTANSDAIGSVMSADGRYVAFIGYGMEYVSTPDTNARNDVYVRDVLAGTTTLLSLNNAGTAAANTGGDYPVISADGRFVLFESSATDMVANPITNSSVFAVAVNGRAQFDVTFQSVNENAGTATLSVTRSGNASASLTAQYVMSNGTAAAPSDYAATTGSLTFAVGESTKTIVIPINDDNIDEPDESFIVNVSDFNADPGAAGSLSMAVVTIVDDDPPPTISIDDIVVNEGNSGSSVAQFTLSLSNVSGKTISVNLAAVNGTATGSDYTLFANLAAIAPGNMTAKVNVNITGETIYEDDETFFINLSNPINATIADSQGMCTIKNDDPVPSITINDVTLPEGNSGSRTFNFSVRLSNPSSRQVTVQFSTADGAANAPDDYASRSGTLTFFPGFTSIVIPITVNGDTYIEPDETFLLNLANAMEASLGDSQGVGTITNDDFPVLLTEQGSNRAIALDSVTWFRDPFSVIAPLNFGSDSRTRVSLFGTSLGLLPGETTAALNVQCDDGLGNTFTLPVEYLGVLPGVDSVWQLVVKLPDNPGNIQQLGVTVTLRGLTSNRATIRIAP